MRRTDVRPIPHPRAISASLRRCDRVCGSQPLSVRRSWAAEPFAVLPSMGQASEGSFAQNLPFELGEDGQQASLGSTGWCGEIQSFRERYEADAEMLEFLQCSEQVCDGPAPAVQSPNEHHIDLTATGSRQQFLTVFSLSNTGTTSRTCSAILQPRRAAYSRTARFCIPSVCWSLVETRAYRPARNIFDRFRGWPNCGQICPQGGSFPAFSSDAPGLVAIIILRGSRDHPCQSLAVAPRHPLARTH